MPQHPLHGRIDNALRDLGCRGLLVLARSTADPNLAPFVGPAQLGQTFLVLPLNSPPRLALLNPMERDEATRSGLGLLTPEELDLPRWSRLCSDPAEALAHGISRALQICGLSPGRLALAGWTESGSLLTLCRCLEHEGWSFTPGAEAIAALRKHKGPEDRLEIERVAAGTMGAFHRVAELLAASRSAAGDLRTGEELWLGAERLRVGRLKAEIAVVLARHLLEQPEGGIVAPAEEGAVPHSSGRDERILKAGQSLVVDLYPKGRFFVDCSRTFCVGTPPRHLEAAHQAVRDALVSSHRLCRPGIRGWTLQEAVCEHLGRAGYPTQISEPGTSRGYVHGLGHGVGYEVHERPFFSEKASEEEGLLEIGDVFTLEPGLYDVEAGFGVRLEDLCAFDGEDIHNLTPLPYDLDPRAWVKPTAS